MRLGPVKLLLLPALVLATMGDFNATEVRCEEAMAHLIDCCPSVNQPEPDRAHLLEGVCGGACNVSRLSSEQSDCILATACGPQMDKICLALVAYDSDNLSLHKSTDTTEVCP